ncbi:1-(5-phosphoribosyl)-5-[(5-phosphoribosylamino)methylideneamino]imidazole-4-carboxamide isomerase [Patescibacteria group bacterium]|nr:1-(5-phosphoribosyl)-5-[(5-phosphoribosylamino)methylideneamino]imidazole-4-carboxamide isomerase [Patescibacteria group bacterium]MCG2692747.1 1-(5-phosphoribosyl)-5-[(5-phosphoribosylamino)methylideneamino]imidazole-4-carboxamide isomerase [Candidatus Parcubacteria bacterium]
MIIIPAIDISEGQVVRLYQGDFQKKQVFGHDPVDQALEFQKAGAKIIHIVDLDGAKAGQPESFGIVKKIIGSVDILIEVGGGIRTKNDVKKYLDAGVSRVVLGTKATEDLEFIKNICQKYGNRIIVGVDSRNGFVMTDGWLEKSQFSTLEFIKKLEAIGAAGIIFTDISRDGTLTEPNYEILEKIVSQVNIPIIASGGVRDLTQLYKLAKIGAEGVIIGKALYAGTLNLKEAIGSF